jgi:rubredoxin---NAD+ reductase
MKPLAIIGSGMAGYTLAREFRKLDTTTPLLILTADNGGFYSKPMLSNAFAQKKTATQLQNQNAAQMAQQLNATIMQNVHVERIDTDNQQVHTSKGLFDYAKLVLAVGAQPIRLSLAGNAADQVLSVNNLADYAVLREKLDGIGNSARVTLLGAGLIGSEFADDLSCAGHQVTVIDPNALPMAALAPQAICTALQQALAAKGVQFELGTTALEVNHHGTATGTLQIKLANGKSHNADLVLSAVGLRPDLRLAQASGIATERGILVDTTGQTNVEDVYALGDCAQYTNSVDGSRPVLPYIAPIMSAARAIARSLTGEITQIDLKATPVIVKTPSCSIALIAPATHISADGRWEHEAIGGVNVSRFFDAQNQMKGFALAPQEAKLRNSLLAELN